MWIVPLDLRPLSRNVQAVLQYGIGSLPAPALYGLVIDLLEEDHSEETAFRAATAGGCLIVISAGVILLIAAYVSTDESDYRMKSARTSDAIVTCDGCDNSGNNKTVNHSPPEDDLEVV